MNYDCVLWAGTIDRQGYAVATVDGKQERVSRIMLAGRLGRPLNAGMFACHKCDTPACVNPNHLWEGTAADNNRDRASKGRSPSREKHGSNTHPESFPRGERCWKARFTEADVREMRARRESGESLSSIGASFNAAGSVVWLIVTRRSWKHVS